MIWYFDEDGRWEAFSSLHDEGSSFVWRISVCYDGTFSVYESDAELTDRKETFNTLVDAKEWCEEQEGILAVCSPWVRKAIKAVEGFREGD